MSGPESSLSDACKGVEHAVDTLQAAATLDALPHVVRSQVVEALIATARLAGLLEALTEGLVTVPAEGGEHHG